jgi:hypothetical protein
MSPGRHHSEGDTDLQGELINDTVTDLVLAMTAAPAGMGVVLEPPGRGGRANLRRASVTNNRVHAMPIIGEEDE